MQANDEQDTQAELIREAMVRLDEREPHNINKHDVWNKVMPEVDRIKQERGIE